MPPAKTRGAAKGSPAALRRTLEAAGVPLGAPRPVGDALPDDLRSVMEDLAARTDALDPAERDGLAAWLDGFRHHWPKQYRARLGPAGDRLREALDRTPLDPNRRLKLRRIAIENLSTRV